MLDEKSRIGRFWHTLLLYQYHPVFEYIPLESILKQHQQKYYDTLESCDKAGNLTTFIEFSLQMILESLKEFLAIFPPVHDLPIDRLHKAKDPFKKSLFSKKEYMDIHKSISTATVSRDLKHGVDQHKVGYPW